MCPRHLPRRAAAWRGLFVAPRAWQTGVMSSPYHKLRREAFWLGGVGRSRPSHLGGLHAPKFPLGADARLAMAGSCFAQHLGPYLRAMGLDVLDAEPGPPDVHPDLLAQWGFGLYAARWGNIYTTRQMVQLLADVATGAAPDPAQVWSRDGRWYDALRPGVEPQGLDSAGDVIRARAQHLARIGPMLRQATHFVFTLGLTEAWACRDTGRVWPSAPGVIAGAYDPARHALLRLTYPQIMGDLAAIRAALHGFNPDMRMILTVSPVAMQATASADHVLVANTQSKASLRAAAGDFAAAHDDVDYFPAYEIILNPAAQGHVLRDRRQVSPRGVINVMRIFAASHGLRFGALTPETVPQPPLHCEETLNQAARS